MENQTPMPSEEYKEAGGLSNMAQLLSQGYTVAAYVMSQETKDSVDAYIAANPNKPAPFRSAPIEIDNTEERISVRLDEPVSHDSLDKVLTAMADIGKHLPPVERVPQDDK